MLDPRGLSGRWSARFQSQRFELQVTPELVKLSKDSLLSLNLAFFRDGNAVTWDVAGVRVEQSQDHGDWAMANRLSAPESSLPQNFQATWDKAQTQAFPFNATVFTNNGTSTIRAIAGGTPPTAQVRYVLSVGSEGDQPQAMMSRELAVLQSAFKSHEQ